MAEGRTRSIRPRLLPLLALWAAGTLGVAGVVRPAAADPVPVPMDAPGAARSELVIKVDREAEFEVSREADGTAVVIRVEQPPGNVHPQVVSTEDPLVGSVAVAADPDGSGALVRVHLRDRTVRTATRTLQRPFRIVLELMDHTARASRSTPAAGARSPFALAVPLPEDTAPPLLTPVVTAATDGPEAEAFRAGQAAWVRGDPDAADSSFRAFLAAHPESPLTEPAGYYLAEVGFHRAYPHGVASRVAAAKVFDDLGQKAPRSPNVALGLVRMGEALLSAGRLDEAARLADVVTGEYSTTPFARPAAYLRARVALQANHLRTALAAFRRVRAGGGSDAEGVGAAFGLAETLGRMGRYPEAVRAYEAGLKYDPGAPKSDPRQLQLMGRALIEDGRFDDARRVFLLLYNLYPDRYPPGLALSRAADTFRGEGRWEQAEEGYQYVIQHHPRGEGSLAARISLADLYVDRHRAIRQPVIATHIVGSRIDSSNADELVAEALRLYGEVVEMAPSDTLSEEAIFKLASLFEELGDYEESLSRLLALVTRYPETDWKRPARELGETALAKRATELLQAHQPGRAVALYRTYREPLFEKRILGWKPLYPLALADEAMGLNRAATGQYLELLASTAPDAYRIRAVYRLGNLYMERGQPGEALKRYAYFVRRYPGGPLTGALYLRMAEAYTALGQDRQAVASYDTYLKRYGATGEVRPVRLALAAACVRAGNPDRARTLYLQVLKEDAGNPGPRDPAAAQVSLRLADLEYAAGRYADARDHYRAAVDAGLEGEDGQWARLRSGTAALALGQPDPARETLAALAGASGPPVIPAVAREIAGSVALK